MTKIAEAVAAVMANVERLKKGDTNEFARYKFTSTDDFKDHLRPLMAKHGLSVSVSEKAFEIIIMDVAGKKDAPPTKRNMVQVTFEIRLHCGEETSEPDSTTVVLDFTGAQTTGAARSYALKEWLKTRFMASSGDSDPSEEADHRAQAEYAGRPINARTGKPMYEKGEAGRQAYSDLLEEIRLTTSEDELKKLVALRKSKIDSLPVDWKKALEADYLDQRDALRAETANGKATEPVNLMAAG